MNEVKPSEVNVQKKESETPNGSERIQARKVYVPVVDIVETDHTLQLVADLPGVDEKEIDITIEKNVLTLKGAVAPEIPEGYKLTYQEYGVGDYERSFTLPNEIDRDGVHATVKDGVLWLTLPKAKQAQTKKVTVVAG